MIPRTRLSFRQRCAFVRAFTGVVSAAPDRQAGAALGSRHRYCSPGSPSAPDRLARRSVNPGFRLGRIGRAACSGAGLSLAKRVGSHQRCTTDERRTVLSIIRTDGIDLDTLDAVAPSHNYLVWAAPRHLLSLVRIESASAAALRKKAQQLLRNR